MTREKGERESPNNVHLLANDGSMAALPDDDGSTARPSLCFRVSLQTNGRPR